MHGILGPRNRATACARGAQVAADELAEECELHIKEVGPRTGRRVCDDWLAGWLTLVGPPQDELLDLTELAYSSRWRGIAPSAGGACERSWDSQCRSLTQRCCPGCDEFIRLFVCRKAISAELMRSLQGRLTGLREEGELIKLELLDNLFLSQKSMFN